MLNRYSYYTKFKIKDEAGIDDFWSYAVFRLNIEDNRLLYERFARLYNILLESRYTLSKQVNLFIYETAEDFIIKIKTHNKELIEKLSMRLNEAHYPYTRENHKLIYTLSKKEGVLAKTLDIISKKKFSVKKPKSSEKKTSKLKILTFLQDEDKADLLNIIERIIDKGYVKFNSELSSQELNDYKTTFSSFSTICNSYMQLQFMANITGELSVILSLYTQECLDKSAEVRSFLQGFINALELWYRQLFVEGCYHSDCMDASFSADLAQFKMLLELYDSVDEGDNCSLDDIFDF